MLKKLELTKTMHHLLLDYCKKKKINFFSSAFDIQSLDFLNSLKFKYFKIPSGEITNIPYLRHVASFKKPIILSTGMSTYKEVEFALNIFKKSGLKKKDITILHCTSEYPTPMKEVNLKAMCTMRDKLKVSVGYSDHTKGIEVAIAAVALGATVIEKHFTIDRNLPGPDHRASLEPRELETMINSIRNIEKALGDGIKRISVSENKNKKIVRKSIVALKLIKKGQKFTSKNITSKRPGTGLSTIMWDDVIGKISKKNFKKNDLIKL
jgi:N,N'-diacetyllegionaminate synthase